MVLAGINAQRKQLAAYAVVLCGVAQVWYVHTATAFDGPDVPFLALFAEPYDLIREVAAAVHADTPQGQFRAVFLFPSL